MTPAHIIYKSIMFVKLIFVNIQSESHSPQKFRKRIGPEGIQIMFGLVKHFVHSFYY